MNTMTVRALMLGLVIALWAWVADAARLHVSLWAGVVALGCFYAAGGGVPGLQKAIVAALSGVVWVLVAHAVRGAIGGGNVVAAVILGATASAIVLQSQVRLLSFTAGRRGPGGTGESFIGVMDEGARLSLRSGPGLVPLTPDAIFCQVAREEGRR